MFFPWELVARDWSWRCHCVRGNFKRREAEVSDKRNAHKTCVRIGRCSCPDKTVLGRGAEPFEKSIGRGSDGFFCLSMHYGYIHSETGNVSGFHSVLKTASDVPTPAERVLTIADNVSETVCECLFLLGGMVK